MFVVHRRKVVTDNTVSRSVAVERLLGRRETTVADTPSETVEIDAIAGRILTEELSSPTDVPPHDCATMDGFAVVAGERSPTVVGAVFPEDDPPTLEPGEAVRIATGAPLPDRANTVLKREDAVVEDSILSGPDLPPGANVYPSGGTARSGERLLPAGERLAPRHAALLSDVGIDTVSVRRRFDVSVVATGTEIHEGRQPDRDSDMLANAVSRWGHVVTHRETVPDEASAVATVIEETTRTHDVVLTTGGTSVGSADHVARVLGDEDVLFESVRIRPGRPVMAAVMNDTVILALPGKPIAAHTAALLVARPFFTGETALPTLSADSARRVILPEAEMEYAVPMSLDDGRAMPVGHVDSSLSLYEERFSPGLVAQSTRTALADGFVLTREPLDPGETVQIVPYRVAE